MSIKQIFTNIKNTAGSSNRRTSGRSEKARREFNVWAWEQNRAGRQARLGA